MEILEKEELKGWFEKNKRDFSWRKEKTPYRVWISEIMLQQTRAEVVRPFFERWMKRFPSIESVEKSSLEEIIKAWEGLGYYQRARSIYKAAKKIVHELKVFPEEKEDLLQIPGIGFYTAGAILAFGFHKKAAAVDGNVIRVLTRYFALSEDASKIAVKERLEEIAERSLCEKEPWKSAEALIELGALICKRTPLCSECPLQKNCRAHQTGRQGQFPLSAKKEKTVFLQRIVLIFEKDKKLLVHKVGKGKVMAGLYEFPYIEMQEEELLSSLKTIMQNWKVAFSLLEKLPIVKQSFTKFLVKLYPYYIQGKPKKEEKLVGYEWMLKSDLLEKAFSSSHKKILEHVIKRKT
jgi:A/G-specific adenine glycosylase